MYHTILWYDTHLLYDSWALSIHFYDSEFLVYDMICIVYCTITNR